MCSAPSRFVVASSSTLTDRLADHNLSDVSSTCIFLRFLFVSWFFFCLPLFVVVLAGYPFLSRPLPMTRLVCVFRSVLSVFFTFVASTMSNTKLPMAKVDNCIHSNSPTIQITTMRLNGVNFLRWSQGVRLYIREQGKLGFIIREKTASKPNNPLFAALDVENSHGYDLACKLHG